MVTRVRLVRLKLGLAQTYELRSASLAKQGRVRILRPERPRRISQLAETVRKGGSTNWTGSTSWGIAS